MRFGSDSNTWDKSEKDLLEKKAVDLFELLKNNIVPMNKTLAVAEATKFPYVQ